MHKSAKANCAPSIEKITLKNPHFNKVRVLFFNTTCNVSFY